VYVLSEFSNARVASCMPLHREPLILHKTNCLEQPLVYT